MSIKIMSRVWEQSKQGGSPLLLLLAIADNANDAGWCWPSQETLAKKIRMSPKSIPRIARKLQNAGELFINNRSDQGKVTRYIVTTGMSSEQFDCAVKNLRLNQSQSAIAKKWFAEIGKKESGQDEAPPSCTPPIAVGRGVDIAVGRGVDIAVGTEPSLTVNEPSLTPNGENGTSNTNKQPTTTQQETNTGHTLTEQQTDELLLFGKHPDSDTPNPGFDVIQEIQNAGWQIRNHIVEQAIVYYIEAVRVHHPGFTVPNNKGVRNGWYKDINGHLQDYRVDDLPELYRMAIEKHAENKWKFTRPGSLTNTLTDVALETGNGDGVVAWL